MERKQLEKSRGGIKEKGDNELDYDPSRIPGINIKYVIIFGQRIEN